MSCPARSDGPGLRRCEAGVAELSAADCQPRACMQGSESALLLRFLMAPVTGAIHRPRNEDELHGGDMAWVHRA